MLTARDLAVSTCRSVHWASSAEVSALRNDRAFTAFEFFNADGSAIRTDSDLFRILKQAMRFPDYFGHNWDALDECLSGMEWTAAPGYVLVMSGADQMWRNVPRIAASFVESWLFAAERWGQETVPFHLVFVW